jgi:hypothetical protein
LPRNVAPCSALASDAARWHDAGVGRTTKAAVVRLGRAGLAASLALASTSASADESARPRVDQPALVRPIPPPPPPPVSRTYMNCVGCAIAGGIVLGAGAAHALVGAVELSDPAPGDEDEGRFLLVLAGLHGVVGLPLLIAGVWPVERTGARAAEATPPPPPPVDIAVGPLGGRLRVTF